MQIFWLRVFSLVTVSAVASANNVLKAKEERKSLMPLSEAQKHRMQETVCEGDLALTGEEQRRCKDNFNWHVDHIRSGLALRCRTNKSVSIQMPPRTQYRLVLLVPPPGADAGDSLEYQIVMPQEKYASLAARTDTTYSIYSSLLDDSGAPTLWHLDGRIHRWTEPELRTYNVQVNVSRTEGITKSVVTWNRTGDMDACFRLLLKCSQMLLYQSRTVWPDSPKEQEFTDLPVNDTCTVYLWGMYGSTNHSFDTYVGEIKTQYDLEPIDNFKLYSEDVGSRWTVRVWWVEQAVQPDTYNVTLRADDVMSVVLPGNATEAEFREVSGAGLYNVTVYSYLGRQVAHYTKHALFTHGAAGWGGQLWRWAGAGAAVWAAAALAAALYWRLRVCQRHLALSAKDKAPLESKAEVARADPVRAELGAPDAWEIETDRLLLHEVIGEGAFGVVRRATLAPLGKQVAVKMLKDFPTVEEMRAFRVEMELMKSVGAHPHVVSLVGCCSARHPAPAIVAEFCSQGDLLNFLRCSWDVMVSKRNASYYNNNTSEYRNDLFKCKLPPEHTRLVVNKMYELQGHCDTDLTPQDLLSFCRQIAMGMEFLALNKVVHRDLAARNILVTGDRTLKIADFGLSRDVYEENQYQQKGNGKMPVKWMALESLARRIYTTQSDVWSFGVVMWEVVTVGGAPYAGVAAARLPRLLRQGYRMQRPPNCTHHLYELMLSCWSARPRDRPSFAELHARLDELLRAAAADQYLSLELDDDPPPPTNYTRYFRVLIKAKRSWTRAESYERPLQAPRNLYSDPPSGRRSPI